MTPLPFIIVNNSQNYKKFRYPPKLKLKIINYIHSDIRASGFTAFVATVSTGLLVFPLFLHRLVASVVFVFLHT